MALTAQEQVDYDLIELVNNDPADTTAPPADTIKEAFDKHNNDIEARRSWFERTLAYPTTVAGAVLGSPVAIGPTGAFALGTAANGSTLFDVRGIAVKDGPDILYTPKAHVYRTSWASLTNTGSNLQTGLTYYLSTTPGLITATFPAAGTWIVEIGIAASPNILDVDVKQPIFWRV